MDTQTFLDKHYFRLKQCVKRGLFVITVARFYVKSTFDKVLTLE